MAASPRRLSLLALLGAVVIGTILLVLGSRAAYTYFSQREAIIAAMQRDAAQSMAGLSKNIVPMIESYAPEEYAKLITTEIELKQYDAIVVRDFNLGGVMGMDAFVSGKLRDARGKIVDFDPDDPAQRQRLQGLFFRHSTPLRSADGQPLGELSIYIADEALRQQLNRTLRANILDALVIAALLIVLLGFLFHRLLVLPLRSIQTSLMQQDASGIPLHPPPSSPYVELGALTDTLRHMLEVIRSSRDTLERQHSQLANVISGANAGTWEWNVQTGELIINERWANLIGYQLAELKPVTFKTWQERVHPEDWQRGQPQLEQHFAGLIPEFRFEFRMRHKDGHWVWLLSIGRVSAWTETGKPLLMSGAHLDISEKKKAEEQIWHQANYDFLTGLPNRRLFIDRVEQEIRKAARHRNHFALFFIDLDRFKEINDTLGHKAGDELLKEAARRIQKEVRSSDTVGRMGGDEFTVLLSDIRDPQATGKVATDILNSLKQPFMLADPPLQISGSLGIALYPDDAETQEDLFRFADLAMYAAKQAGRNCFRFYVKPDSPHADKEKES